MLGCGRPGAAGARQGVVKVWDARRRAQLRLLEKEKEALKSKSEADRRRLAELGREKERLAKQGTQAESAAHRQARRDA